MNDVVTFWLVALSTCFGFSFLTFLVMSHKDGKRISYAYWAFVICTVAFILVMLHLLSCLRYTHAC